VIIAIGLIPVIENLNVKNIVISKQPEMSNEFKNIIEIANKRRIPIKQVKSKDKIHIERNIYIDILFPEEELKYDDLNNNSIVCKLVYNNFSVLFTGDIEKTEQDLLKLYDQKKLKADVIKISHHGSGTSSNKNFLEAVNPKISLIGVSKNNNFGHPSVQVIERLKDLRH
jgi:competence protein ComEC